MMLEFFERMRDLADKLHDRSRISLSRKQGVYAIRYWISNIQQILMIRTPIKV